MQLFLVGLRFDLMYRTLAGMGKRTKLKIFFMLLLLQKSRITTPVVRISLSLLFVICGISSVQAQLSATMTSTLNTNCDGTDCNYSGPSILINELMISPVANDGSISGNGVGGGGSGRGEWIELYNPDICEPIDISCYYLGNDTPEGNGGFVIPAGTIIPPAGFCLIRGGNMPAVPSNLLVANGGNVVELVVPFNISDPGVCTGLGATRIWFPNTGGWFAFYDSQGIPQDAVSWGSQANTSGSPCIAALGGCTSVAGLGSYNAIPAARKVYVSNDNASNHMGLSIKRISDGGNWDINNPGSPTYATCNGVCAVAGTSSCTGTATATVTGGTAPYSYQWDDSQAQTTATAIDLCEGTYNVTITDFAGEVLTVSVFVDEFVPTVALNLVDSVCINAGALALTGGTPVATPAQDGIYSGASVSANSFNPTTAGTGPHTITYTFTDEFGCTNFATDAITVNPMPVVTITGLNNAYCVNAPADAFTVSPAGGVLTGPGIVGSNFNPATAGAGTHTLTYTFTDDNGCAGSASQVITVNPLPVVTMTGVTGPYCINAAAVPLTLQPAGGTLTGPGISGTTFTPSTAGAGTHTLTYTVTNANGCTSASTQSVIVNPLPVVSITDVASPYCMSNNPESLTLQPAGGVLSGPGVVANTFIPATAGLGTHNLTYAYTDPNGCSSSASVTVQVVPAPAPTFTIPDLVCIYDPVITLTAIPAGGVFTVNNNTTPQTTLDPAAIGAGNHNVNYAFTDPNGCIGTATEPIVIIPRPALSLTLAANYCYETPFTPLNPSPAGGTLSGALVSGTGLDLATAAPGAYNVTYSYTDPNGCADTMTQNFTVSPRLFPDFEYSVNCTQIAIFDNNTPALPAPAAFSWELGGTGTSAQANPVVPFVVPGDYLITLTATDTYGCAYDTVKSIYIQPGVSVTDLQLPNVITANGDNLNDYIEFSTYFLECFSYKMYILNRWGNVVYEMSNTNNRFYGLDKAGNDLQDGVYFYIIESADIDCDDPIFKPICSGNITIAR